MEPQSLPGEFNLPSVRPSGVRGSVKTVPLFDRCRRVHFLRAERHDRFFGGQKAIGKVTPALASGSVIARSILGHVGRPWKVAAASGFSALFSHSTGAHCSAV